MKLGDYIIVLLFVIAIVAITILFNTNKRLTSKIDNFRPDTVLVSDTIIDTLEIEKPKYIKRIILDTFYIPCIDDSVVTIELEQKEYKDSAYHAWVSGFMVQLDSLEIYNKIIRDSIIITKPVVKKGLWLHIKNHRYIGIGLVEE